ncbi:MAG: ATP-dependent helicase HrpB [Ilumatobacteraceae bacterium]
MPFPIALHDLPINEVLGDLGESLAAGRDALLVAPPGAGKTTAAPLWLVDQPWLDGQRIVILEPRRLATRAAAQRMASLLNERVGQTVGYQTRDERHIGPTTRIEVVTEGVLTRRLQTDPSLAGVGLLVFDEIHERNLPSDVGLALALDARTTVCPRLRILAMSATPDVVRVQTVLPDAVVLTSDGRVHPVDVRWFPPPKGERIEQTTATAVGRALRDETGDVLVFLPGIGEIRRVQQLLAGDGAAGVMAVKADVDVYALAGALSVAEQDAALAPSPPGRRRVVLSTDIAESSLTVAGVRVVIDAGLARVPRYDQRTGMTRLTTVSTSRASSEQRSGRAGRTEPGVAYRLWSKLEHASRRAHLEAEITQIDLAGLALELSVWGTPMERLQFIDPPPGRTFKQGVELLQRLGALDSEEHPTEIGRQMLRLPLHPRLARMVDGASAYESSLACVIAALLDERDVFRGRIDELPADLGLRVAAVCGQAHDRADGRDVRRVRDRAADLARRAGLQFKPDNVRPERCGALLALAYPDRIAVRRSRPGGFQMRSGAGAWTSPTDSLAVERFVVAADLDGRRDNARIRIGAALDVEELIEALTDQIEHRQSLVWDKQRDDLVLRCERRLGGMLLDEQTRTPPTGPETTSALLERVRSTRLGALHWSDAAESLRKRVGFLRREPSATTVGGQEWPDWSDKALIASLDQWLAPYLVAATGAQDLAHLDTAMLLSAWLGWDAAVLLDELAPADYVTANGHRVTIDYSRDVPTVSVRVQDLFGTRQHPSIVGGSVNLAMELLSPADRPVQITSDLPRFWAGSWALVRKEMIGRYPKHQWPVDPANAVPHRLK